jgi:hypothetical protein
MSNEWKMVPVEPMKEQTLAVCMHPDLARSLYRSMVLAAPLPPAGDVIGYAFHNPDTGMEWSEDHPRESGEVPDAGRCQRMTLTGFREKYGVGGDDTTGFVPPAGDVVVLATLDRSCDSGVTLTDTGASWHMDGTDLVDIDHVTRLTAERDGATRECQRRRDACADLITERDGLLAEVKHLRLHKNDYMESAEESRKALRSELTKARELLQRAEPWLRRLNEKSDNEIPAFVDLVEFLAHQPAPAAKGGHAGLDPQRIKGMIEAASGEYAIMIDPENGHFGWTFKRHPDGQWVSGRKATEAEMYAARQHANSTGQGV